MPVHALRHIRKMRGGAQAHLIQTEDGFYVVKFRNNPQHRRILINELVCSVFLDYLQLHAPKTAVVCLGEDFLRGNPEICIQLGAARIAVPAGWHFGSQYPGDPDRIAVYDFLPDALLREVANLSDFLGVLVFDKWIANADGRQSIFYRAAVSRWSAARGSQRPRPGFVARMIDHGFALNGPYWDLPDSPLQGLYHRHLVYEGVRSLDDFQPWLDRIVHFPEEVVDEAYKQVPRTWLEEGEEDALESVLENLLKRRKRVPDLLLDCRNARVAAFPNWK
jgi:hypothetical protein